MQAAAAHVGLVAIRVNNDGPAPPDMYVVSARLAKRGTTEEPQNSDLAEHSYTGELSRVIEANRIQILEAIESKTRPPSFTHRFGSDEVFDVNTGYHPVPAAMDPFAHTAALRQLMPPTWTWELVCVLHQVQSRAVGDDTPSAAPVAAAAAPAPAPAPAPPAAAAAPPPQEPSAPTAKPKAKTKKARSATPRRSKRRRLT